MKITSCIEEMSNLDKTDIFFPCNKNPITKVICSRLTLPNPSGFYHIFINSVELEIQNLSQQILLIIRISTKAIHFKI